MCAHPVNGLTTFQLGCIIGVVNVSLTFGKICSCFGHRQIEESPELLERIYCVFEDLIEKGFETFLFGGFGQFDTSCHKVVSELKKKYPKIRRIYCLSDQKHERPHKRPKRLKNEDYEEFVYLPLEFDYWYQRLYYRNCEMIKMSDHVIFYVNNTENSGAYKAMQYAVKNKKDYTNLG